jgi:AcrR family transcriptional regulator
VEFTAQGADAPVSAIAARAGVGIGSLYRRYPTKEALIQHLCVLAMEQTIDAASAALEAEDVWAGLAGYIRTCVDNHTGALAPVAGTIAVTPAMLRTSRRGMRLADALVQRAHDAGVLRADVTTLDISLLIEQFSRRSTTMPAAEEGNALERLLAIALDGLRASDADPLPGRPPSRAAYVGRWDSGR